MKVNCMRCYLAVYVICIYVFHTHDYTATVTATHLNMNRKEKGEVVIYPILFCLMFHLKILKQTKYFLVAINDRKHYRARTSSGFLAGHHPFCQIFENPLT